MPKGVPFVFKLRAMILLFSGGKESLYNLYKFKNKITCLLFFNYGQKALPKELESLHYYSKKFLIPYEVIDLKLYLPEAIEKATGLDSNVPMRNTLFLSYAINMFKPRGEDTFIVGTVKHIKDPYTNDGFDKYLKDISTIVKRTENVKVISASGKAYSEDIVKYLLKKDISKLWLCFNDTDKHCGECIKCRTFVKESEGTVYRKILKNILYDS